MRNRRGWEAQHDGDEQSAARSNVPRFSKITSLANQQRLTAATIAAAPAAAISAATSATPAVSAAATAAAISTTSAATATSAAAVSAAATASVSATAAAAARTIFARLGFVDGERPAVERLAVELIDRVFRVFIAPHRHEGEPARFSGEAILDQHDFRDGARLGEGVLEVGFRGVERQVPHVEFIPHF